jgi:hypothetical protein
MHNTVQCETQLLKTDFMVKSHQLQMLKYHVNSLMLQIT